MGNLSRKKSSTTSCQPTDERVRLQALSSSWIARARVHGRGTRPHTKRALTGDAAAFALTNALKDPGIREFLNGPQT